MNTNILKTSLLCGFLFVHSSIFSNENKVGEILINSENSEYEITELQNTNAEFSDQLLEDKYSSSILSSQKYAGGFRGFSTVEYPNVIKLNLSSLSFLNASLQYERLFDNNQSMAIGLRFMPPMKMPLAQTVQSMIGEDDENVSDFFTSIKMYGFALTPEYRFYFGQEAGRGFYIAPFARYENFGIKSSVGIVTTNETYQANFKGTFSNVGVGLLIGSQFVLSDHFTLDWFIAGPYVGKMTMKLSARDFEVADADFTEFEDAVNSYKLDFIGFKTEVHVTNTTADVKLSSLSTFIRSMGINLCYRF